MTYPIDPLSKLKIGDQIIGPIWVLEWSQSQQCFHVETLIECVQAGIMGFFNEGRAGDYVIVGMGESREKIDELYLKMVDQMKLWGLSQFTPEDLLRDLSP